VTITNPGLWRGAARSKSRQQKDKEQKKEKLEKFPGTRRDRKPERKAAYQRRKKNRAINAKNGEDSGSNN